MTHTQTHSRSKRCVAGILSLAFLCTPLTAVAGDASYEQHFTITAYYSPLPDQCCYVKGSFEADKILNGNGTHGADGTPVYPGMLAAPKSYAFGTVVDLPGIGTLTVHDRGGAIVEGSDTHRLDIWMGSGEEGLARALAFGVRRVVGTVHPPGSAQPKEGIDLTAFAAPLASLKTFAVSPDAAVASPARAAYGETNESVTALQQSLKDAGYFAEKPTGFFGDKTKASLLAFEADMGITGSGTHLSDVTSVYLQATIEVKKREPTLGLINKESSRSDILNAQRLLRGLGYYRGRTSGAYDGNLFDAILALQKEYKLVGDASSPGAGRIGPLTRGVIVSLWRKSRIDALATKMIELNQVKRLLADRGLLLDTFVAKGESGDAVRVLQTFLASAGYFPYEKINGNFGEMTEEAVTKYQLAQNIIASPSAQGAGNVGPSTLQAIRDDQVARGYGIVRSHGWSAL